MSIVIISNTLRFQALFAAMTDISAEIVAPGVEMISHQTWTTGNASGHVEDNNDVFFLQQVLGHQ